MACRSRAYVWFDRRRHAAPAPLWPGRPGSRAAARPAARPTAPARAAGAGAVRPRGPAILRSSAGPSLFLQSLGRDRRREIGDGRRETGDWDARINLEPRTPNPEPLISYEQQLEGALEQRAVGDVRRGRQAQPAQRVAGAALQAAGAALAAPHAVLADVAGAEAVARRQAPEARHGVVVHLRELLPVAEGRATLAAPAPLD